jgi:hypothetical protein
LDELQIQQALFQSYLPLPKCLGQIMHFCKLNWADLMETYLKLLQAFFCLSSIGMLWKIHGQNKCFGSFLPNKFTIHNTF